jgi:hypothetical protein
VNPRERDAGGLCLLKWEVFRAGVVAAPKMRNVR